MVNEETLEADVLYVGAGPATLASAIRLSKLAKSAGRTLNIALIEKAKSAGVHQLSGAVMDPSSFRDVLSDLGVEDPNLGTRVGDDHFYFLSSTQAFKLPFTPPSLRNHGNYIISLSELTAWLAQKAEQQGIDIFFGFPGQEILFEGDRVAGVKTGNKGIGRDGNRKSNYEPGVKIRAKVTVFGEGVRGSLTKVLVSRLGLDEGRRAQVYATGLKEIWKVLPEKHTLGCVMHTMGFPLGSSTFGGGFIYHAKNGLVYLGLVVGLDYEDPTLDLHGTFSRFKQHPIVRHLLEGGEMIRYGAKAIPEGGYYSMPRYWGDGFVIVGDGASFLNSCRLKGIHLAMKSGQLAAEAIFNAIEKNDCSQTMLSRYRDLVEGGSVKHELWGVRNFHQGFQSGLWGGLIQFSLQILSGGRGLFENPKIVEDHLHLGKVQDDIKGRWQHEKIVFDDKITFTKTTDVFRSGTIHHEDQPVHLHVSDTEICRTKCAQEFGNPCERFCPANVYEMVEKEPGRRELQINASNCVHCKTCDIKDPYGIITWVTPEGGGGPDYTGM
ncbi:MAG: electron transfer flavoprotein-ubiquinone oxidoreductase [Candidatus Omnitrophica bacterium]|nr:electron transfer flavoprotein-ubiquinone oxidoreductase [Candidatus Omnitrophota bacterium]